MDVVEKIIGAVVDVERKKEAPVCLVAYLLFQLITFSVISGHVAVVT